MHPLCSSLRFLLYSSSVFPSLVLIMFLIILLPHWYSQAMTTLELLVLLSTWKSEIFRFLCTLLHQSIYCKRSSIGLIFCSEELLFFTHYRNSALLWVYCTCHTYMYILSYKQSFCEHYRFETLSTYFTQPHVFWNWNFQASYLRFGLNFLCKIINARLPSLTLQHLNFYFVGSGFFFPVEGHTQDAWNILKRTS